jgi:hypothetical protein
LVRPPPKPSSPAFPAVAFSIIPFSSSVRFESADFFIPNSSLVSLFSRFSAAASLDAFAASPNS